MPDILHYFYQGYTVHHVDGWFHTAVQRDGTVGPTHTFSNMFTGNATPIPNVQPSGFGCRPIIVNKQILVPYIDANGHPALWRGNAQSLDPAWTSELVSNDVMPGVSGFNTLDYSPSIAVDENGVLFYAYMLNDFATFGLLKLCTNSGSGWSAPATIYDLVANPPPNDPGIGISSGVQNAGLFAKGGKVYATACLDQQTGLNYHNEVLFAIVNGLPVAVDQANFAGLTSPYFAGRVIVNGIQYVIADGSGTNVGMFLYSSADGGNTWTQRAQVLTVNGQTNFYYDPVRQRIYCLYSPTLIKLRALGYFDLLNPGTFVTLETTFDPSTLPPLAPSSAGQSGSSAVAPFSDGSVAFMIIGSNTPAVPPSNTWMLHYSFTPPNSVANGIIVNSFMPATQASGNSQFYSFVMDSIVAPGGSQYLTLAFKGEKVYPQQ